MFVEDANANPTDYGENMCRATACEVLARKSVHRMPAHRLQSVMSTRYRYRERDGDASAPTCALETAIDQHCTVSYFGFARRFFGQPSQVPLATDVTILNTG